MLSSDGEVYRKGIYSYRYGMIYLPDTIEITPEKYKFSLQPRIDLGMSYELIFSGRNDVSLNLTYREFTKDDLARPSFYQVLTYEGNAKQIRFKDFVIKIHSVDNEKITYTILADGLK